MKKDGAIFPEVGNPDFSKITIIWMNKSGKFRIERTSKGIPSNNINEETDEFMVAYRVFGSSNDNYAQLPPRELSMMKLFKYLDKTKAFRDENWPTTP